MLYYYISFPLIFRSPITFSLNSGDIYFSLSFSSFVSKLFCGDVFETLVILSETLFQIKSPVASAVF